jgi:hypothetical protein
MAIPAENETVQYGLLGVKVAKGTMGVPRLCDILFTENGMALVVTASGLKLIAGAAGAGGFGMIGAAVARSKITSDSGKARNQFQGKTIPQMLAMNEKSMYLAYSDIVQVSIKKGLTGIAKMDIFVSDGKYHCEFSKEQFDIANAAVNGKMGIKVNNDRTK